MRAAVCWTVLAALLLPGVALAGFTDTLPQSTFMLDIGYLMSTVEYKWNNEGEMVPLIEDLVRYEPGSGKQGVLKPRAIANLHVLVPQLLYGVTDSFSLGFGLPIMVFAEVDPRFGWEEGDYQWNLGRAYSEDDFWTWAGTMGQPKPGKWRGNEWQIGDLQIAGRWRYSDFFSWFKQHDVALSTMVFVALPTGKKPDPEAVVTSGTTSWDLHSNGDLGFHFGADKFFNKSLDGRLTLGIDLFYEFLFPKTYDTPTGRDNPLMLSYAPYVGDTYTIDGGDFSGGSAQVDVVPIKGPALGTWLVKGDVEKAKALPPLVTMSFRWTYIHLQQTRWESDSKIWDWEKEKEWRPGYKNMLWGQMTLSLLRVGLPLQPYVNYRNLTWIPSKNTRAPNVLGFGTRMLMKFW
jgi:hypothetical protein